MYTHKKEKKNSLNVETDVSGILITVINTNAGFGLKTK